jgi:hypothetical protein
MCCFFTALVFLGPRAGILIWWLINPVRWQATLDRPGRLRGRRYVGGRRDRQPGPHSGLALIVRLKPAAQHPNLDPYLPRGKHA